MPAGATSQHWQTLLVFLTESFIPFIRTYCILPAQEADVTARHCEEVLTHEVVGDTHLAIETVVPSERELIFSNIMNDGTACLNVLPISLTARWLVLRTFLTGLFTSFL